MNIFTHLKCDQEYVMDAFMDTLRLFRLENAALNDRGWFLLAPNRYIRARTGS